MRGRAFRNNNACGSAPARLQALRWNRVQEEIFQSPDICNGALWQAVELLWQSRVLLSLLFVLALRPSLLAQGQGILFSRALKYQTDFYDGYDSGDSSAESHLNNATPTVASGELSDVCPAINRDEIGAGAPLCDESFSGQSGAGQTQSAPDGDQPGADPKPPAVVSIGKIQRPDRNLDIYYRNRREFSLDIGWHPVNIPFVYDFAVGDSYNMTPLKYTLVPIVASLRWHITNVGWRSFFRGNMDFTFSGSITAIPRGPETHYYSFDFGIRRNFVYRNWRAVPFFEQRGGAGLINAKEPLGVVWAQGQNLTFTYNMGAGVRYNLDSKYSFSAGMNYMHISNGYLSQPAFYNYGINVYGPMFGFDMRLGKPRQSPSQ